MKFTETHEWIRIENHQGIVGISSYAQKELGELVYVELPEVGKKVKAGEEIAVLESTKAAADVYSPVAGTIVEVNKKLKEDSSLLNASPEREGWLVKLEIDDLGELDNLMGQEEYQNMLR